ncbi:MFS transporter [Corallincola luteus]|uniref:MFS transporter n=1 Tax=Corallincola luteus TaxID=1775177 RepID=A0ABY2ASW6_9GAMM|nr:MFS transporter [Corallincola luteus]TCI05212.1 MFS transporter [Corallincola luteus]
MNTKHNTRLPRLVFIFSALTLERLGYYGFRAILVLFLVQATAEGGLGIATNDAISYFGIFTMLSYLLVMIGGFCADFLLSRINTILSGAVMSAIGLFGLYLSFSSATLLWPSLILIALGTSFFRPAIWALTADICRGVGAKQDGVFTLLYLGTTIGALISGLFVGWTTQLIGYSGSFIPLALFMLLSGGLLFFFPHITQTETHGRPSTRTLRSVLTPILIILFACGLSCTFWYVFDEISNQLYPLQQSIDLGGLTHAIGPFLTSFLWLPLGIAWIFVPVNSWLKLAAGILCLVGASQVLTSALYGNNDQLLVQILVIEVLLGFSEVLIAPVIISLVSQYGSQRFIATSFAVVIFAGGLANSLPHFLGPMTLTSLPTIISFLLTATTIILVSVGVLRTLNSRKITSPQSEQLKQ